MTITNVTSRIAYDGDDASVNFAVPYKFFLSSELEVISRVIATGVDTVLTEGADYTVTGGGGAAGTVVATVAPASTVQWIITRTTSRTQQSDYVNNAALSLNTVESDLDRNAMRDIEIDRELTKSLKIPEGDDPTIGQVIPNSVERASKYLGFSAAGVPVPLDTPAGTTALSVWGAAWGVLANAAAGRADLGVIKLGAGTAGAKPAANVFGEGLYYETDTHRVFYSNATAWFEITLEHFAQASVPAAATAGRKFLDTTRYQPWYDDGAALRAIRHFPTGYMNGLAVTYATATTFTAQTGGCRNRSDLTNLILTSALTKTVNAAGAWSAGAAGNAFTVASPAPASDWRRVFIIGKDDGSTDVGCDGSINATNLLAESGYDWFRRIGWIYLDGAKQLVSSFVNWYLGDNDWTFWSQPQTGHTDGGDVDRTAGAQITCAMAPSSCWLRGNITTENLAGQSIFLHGDQTAAAAPSMTATELADIDTDAPRPIVLALNSSQQFYCRADDTCKVHLDVHAWWDNRQGA